MKYIGFRYTNLLALGFGIGTGYLLYLFVTKDSKFRCTPYCSICRRCLPCTFLKGLSYPPPLIK